jgi:hypothetical protein
MGPVNDRTFAYQPGGWFGIVGEHATVLLPGTEKERAGALWVLVDDGAGFDAVLDALVAGGLTTLPGFVLLASDEDTTRVVIRGDASATFEAAEGTVHVAGSSSTMWVERVLHEVTHFAVALPGESPSGPRLAVASGLVRVAAMETPVAAPAAGPTTPPPPPLTPPPAPRLELVPDPLTDEIDLTQDELGDLPDDLPDDEPGVRSGDVLGGPPSWTPPTPPPPPAPPLPPVPTLPPPAPSFPPPAPPAPPAWADDEVTEQLSAVPPDLPPLREPEPEPQGAWDHPTPVAHLSFSSGDEVDVTGLVVIGRAPDAGRFPADEEPTLVTVPSPHSEISSTHVEVRPGTGDDHGSAVVTDLGSTNGTLLIQPGQRPEELRPGVPVVLQSGALIDLGDGLTIRVAKI